MRSLLIALTGFIVAAGLIATIALATPRTASDTANGMRSGEMMNAASQSTMMAGGQRVQLMIQHVQKGCHVWSNGRTTATTMRLHLVTGQKLSILDMDIDSHQMMESSGPMHMPMGAPMMMNRGITMTFIKRGVYHLGTKTVETKGTMHVKTIGPDNNLRLVVTVA